MRNLRDLQDELDRHNTYGGAVDESSFNHLTMKDIVKQIESEWAFDRTCKTQCAVRDEKYQLKKLSKEVLNNES